MITKRTLVVWIFILLAYGVTRYLVSCEVAAVALLLIAGIFGASMTHYQDEASNKDAERILSLLDGLYSREEALQWINFPNKLLGGDTPRHCIERGDIGAVEMIIEQFKSGACA